MVLFHLVEFICLICLHIIIRNLALLSISMASNAEDIEEAISSHNEQPLNEEQLSALSHFKVSFYVTLFMKFKGYSRN